ncbi:cytochrome P450 [Pseudonocardia kunmingensis]|uniref:Cytochrome P450 n=1 Tax=Pseudonocardia kunmingensis TaxID=630975 RepID=A0A543CX02_9PSEU|nr:cytochrome P450 [Pseudonocardia kunmingensis]TQM01635.1 hypothetical protein FB558_8529 [Pseudonocardia kunmingensis]
MTSTSSALPSTPEAARTFDMFDLPPGYIQAPYPWFRALRDHDPVHRNGDGTVLLTRYADVRTVWRDVSAIVDKNEMFHAKFGDGPLYEHHSTAMLFRDPPDHDRLRAVVTPFFSPGSVERLRPFIENLVEDLLDEAEDRVELDFVDDFAARIPIALITRILGVPPEDGDLLRAMGLTVLLPLNPTVSPETVRAGHEGAAQFIDYLDEHVQRVRAKGVDGDPETVLEALVAAHLDGDRVSIAEVVHMCLLLMNGGHETTTNLMAVGAHSLLDHPDQYCGLGAGTGLGDGAVEELIRFVTPLQLQGRRTTRPADLPSSGVTLPAGTEVILCQASANRDERAFDRPDVLDLGRRPNAHVSFGLGVHVCVGRPLARLETRIVFPRLAARFPGLQRAGDPVWNDNVRFRGLRSLPVRTS